VIDHVLGIVFISIGGTPLHDASDPEPFIVASFAKAEGLGEVQVSPGCLLLQDGLLTEVGLGRNVCYIITHHRPFTIIEIMNSAFINWTLFYSRDS
jgi:hypothetical protein